MIRNHRDKKFKEELAKMKMELGITEKTEDIPKP